ncbi:MAG: proline--tRNA ligase [Candidatus Paceibacterota bacterium]
MKEQTHEKAITPRAEDYSQWYLDIIAAADLAEYAPVKGCMIIKPYGYAIWEQVQKVLDTKFKDLGVQNAYFPLLIPERLLKREAQHVEGFAPEVAVVTHAGGEKLEEPLVIRPTSETIMYEVFSGWVHSYRDLPLLINQWANVVRWELKTKPFLRTTEFLWQEGHTVHVTQEEADAYARQMLGVYEWFARDYMAIPVITGTKTDNERFAGALKTYCTEAMMQDGKALQYATSHNLGDNFAKAFDIQFLDDQNTPQYGWQTSWGLSTRSIGGLIMTHSDDKGLVLPPRMTATPIVLVPVFNTDNKEEVIAKAKELATMIAPNNIHKVRIDSRDHMRVGEKFFEWEKKGVPVRVEYGPKDIAANQCVVVRRDTGEKKVVMIDENIATTIDALLESIQTDLFATAQQRLTENTIEANTWEEFTQAIENGKFVLAHWDGTTATEKKIKEEMGATIRCIPFSQKLEDGTCIKTGEPSAGRVLFAKAY